MSVIFRILLFTTSVFTAVFISRKIKKSQMQVFDAIYWILFAVLLILMSIFPNAVSSLTNLLGIISPANFVFLVMVFLLIMQCFTLSVKLSSLEEKVKNLVEELSVRQNLKDHGFNMEDSGK